MKMIHVPAGAWMRYRSKGAYRYAVNSNPIIWTTDTSRIPANTQVYCVAWGPGQHRLIASKVINSSEVIHGK